MKKILLADDEMHLRLLVLTTLEGPEYQIIEATNGEQALELARQEQPDLVVLDWLMPGLPGIEVTRLLRNDPGTSNMPILMLTAKSDEKDRLEGKTLGVDKYVVKPFSPLELLQSVRTLLA